MTTPGDRDIIPRTDPANQLDSEQYQLTTSSSSTQDTNDTEFLSALFPSQSTTDSQGLPDTAPNFSQDLPQPKIQSPSHPSEPSITDNNSSSQSHPCDLDIDPSSPFPLLQFGTFVVIGAMAANVIGFRYSRWAVGKEIHRGWEKRQHYHQSRKASNSASQARARRTEEIKREQARQKAAREQAERLRQEQRQRTYDAQAQADQRARQNARTSYETWEKQFGGGGTGFWQQTNFRVDVDPRIIEEMLKAQRNKNPFAFHGQILEELLKAAQAAQSTQSTRTRGRTNRVDDDFDPFKFWEQMNGAQWNDFGQSSSQGPRSGVFQRAHMDRHYNTLGVKPSASDAEIKAAYRKQVMKWHPDRYRGNNPTEAAKKFREVTEAYDALSKK